MQQTVTYTEVYTASSSVSY